MFRRKNLQHLKALVRALQSTLAFRSYLLNSRLSVKIGEYDRSSPLIKEIEKNHVIIKGVEPFYEKIGFLQ